MTMLQSWNLPSSSRRFDWSALVKDHGDALAAAICAVLVGLGWGLHGLGFAGALTSVGLPQSDIPLALLLFNIGVEIGQLMFVFTVLAIIAILKRVRPQWPDWSGWLAPYAIGSLSAFWMIDRIAGFWEVG